MPLGFVSLAENLMMVAMAVWMAVGALGLVDAGTNAAAPARHGAATSAPAGPELPSA